MKIEGLLCFQAVAKYNSFTKAAESVFISQSALSKKIQTLENELGGELFKRGTKGNVSLSPYGEYLSNSINNLLEDYEILLNASENYRNNHQKKLTIATFLNVAHSGMIKPITEFEALEPNFYIETTESDHTTIKQELSFHQAEVGFGYRELLGEIADFQITPLFEDSLILITSKKYADKMGWGDSISLEEAKNACFCFPREDMVIFSFLVNTCRSHGFIPQLTNSNVRLGTIREYISAGMRCTLQFESISRSKFYDGSYNEQFVFIALTNAPKLTMSIYSDSSRGRHVREEFISYISNYYNRK